VSRAASEETAVTTQGESKMAAVRLGELELVEAWVEGEPTVRARFDFPLHAASGCASSSVIYYEVDPGNGTPRHIHTCEEIQMILEGTAEVEVGTEVERLAGESLAVVPALVPHAIRNVGETALRVVGFFSSAAAVHVYEDTIMPLGANVLVIPPPDRLRLP
jgi:mannose-6-phosphate isomerase-like protein (cupin superfamily)